jgi:hypothetical protein
LRLYLETPCHMWPFSEDPLESHIWQSWLYSPNKEKHSRGYWFSPNIQEIGQKGCFDDFYVKFESPAVSILGGRWGDSPLFLRIHPYFLRGRGKILHRQRRKKINKCNKFSLFDKNPPWFSNPRIDTVLSKVGHRKNLVNSLGAAVSFSSGKWSGRLF